MHVLIIGYGKIGRIKARIWAAHGHRVTVHDIDPLRLADARDDGFEAFDKVNDAAQTGIVDISTPASFHLPALKWALNILPSLPRVILIEKPLVSSQSELVEFKEFLQYHNPAAASRIAINESYYASSAARNVLEQLRRGGCAIQAINIELSKNRLTDVFGGRFTDPHLGIFGIEVPHTLALLQHFGIGLESLIIKDVCIFRRAEDIHNEGIRLSLTYEGIDISLESYLGDFKVTENGVEDNKTTRSAQIVTDDKSYLIEFDPVPDAERYVSRINVSKDSRHIDTILMEDDHMSCHLKHVSAMESIGQGEYFAVNNAITISEMLLRLKGQARYCTI